MNDSLLSPRTSCPTSEDCLRGGETTERDNGLFGDFRLLQCNKVM